MMVIMFIVVIFSMISFYEDIQDPEISFFSGKVEHFYFGHGASVGEKISFRLNGIKKEFIYYSTNVKYSEVRNIIEEKHNIKLGIKPSDPNPFPVYYFEDLDTNFIINTDEITKRNIYKYIIVIPLMAYIFYFLFQLEFGKKKRKKRKKTKQKRKKVYKESIIYKNNEVFLNVVKEVPNSKGAFVVCIFSIFFGFIFMQIEGLLFQIAGWGLLGFFGIIGTPILAYKAFFRGMAYKINEKGIYSYNFDSAFRFIAWEDIQQFSDTVHGVYIITHNDFHTALKNFPLNPFKLPLWLMATGNYFITSFRGMTFRIEADKFDITNKKLISTLDDYKNKNN
jgi:hypothetical protein